MPHPANPVPTVIGCDVGKTDIAVFDSATGRASTIANTADALDAFAAALPRGCLIVCEATGGYEAALLDAASRAGHAAHRADARRVKAFIRSLGTLAKTDALDARALARYGQERHDRLDRWRPRDEQRQQLATLVATRSDIVRARTACTNRLKAPGAAPVAGELRALAEAHDQTIRALDIRIEALLASCAPLARTAAVLRSISGIGATTAAALIALLPELGTLDRRQIASLAGLAPPSTPERRCRRLSTHPRRTPRGQTHPLHGNPIRRPLRPPAQGLLPAAARQRQKTHRRARRSHA